MAPRESVATLTETELLDAARGGDEAAFARLVEPHHGLLHAHCYRMLGSVHDAEDALQDALLRAWKGLPRFEGRSAVRTWLYTIATNTCLNLIARRPKRVLPVDYTGAADPHGGPGEPVVESVWLEPYPDAGLSVGEGPAGPGALYEQREGVELAFVAALQHLPPSQRAVLIMREVLGFSAKEVAETLDTTVAAVNSGLQRARKAVEERTPAQSQQATLRALGDDELRAIVDAYVEAWERGDVDAVVARLTEDATLTMPPLASWFRGHDALRTFLSGWPLSGAWRWRHVAGITANAQPAIGCYAFDEAIGCYLPFALEVLGLRGDRIAEITAFVVRATPSPEREVYARWIDQPLEPAPLLAAFGRFGLPERLD